MTATGAATLAATAPAAVARAVTTTPPPVGAVGEGQKPVAHEVTIGISNTRFTEMISGPLKAGDALITRRADGPGDKK